METLATKPNRFLWILPATEAEAECYARMYKECRNLKIVPPLELKTLKNDCCKEMFKGCGDLHEV